MTFGFGGGDFFSGVAERDAAVAEARRIERIVFMSVVGGMGVGGEDAETAEVKVVVGISGGEGIFQVEILQTFDGLAEIHPLRREFSGFAVRALRNVVLPGFAEGRASSNSCHRDWYPADSSRLKTAATEISFRSIQTFAYCIQ
jgi:hypothetical protein